MKLPSRPKYGRCGVPVNVKGKQILRNRSVLLSNAQRHVLRQMGLKKVDKGTTEKEAVRLVKRIVNFESAYVRGYVSPWTRKRINNKPKNISERQHMINVLMHREEQGSKSATKDLAKLQSYDRA